MILKEFLKANPAVVQERLALIYLDIEASLIVL